MSVKNPKPDRHFTYYAPAEERERERERRRQQEEEDIHA
jgi:hypothetical protein